MMARNNNAEKAEARRLSDELGITYAHALRRLRERDRLEVSKPPSPGRVAEIAAVGWVGQLADASLSSLMLEPPPPPLSNAEIDSVSDVTLGNSNLVEAFEGETELHAVEVYASVTVRAWPSSTSSPANELDDDRWVLLPPREALLTLDVRVDAGELVEYLEIADSTWL